ncbi:MAG: hypothetical protein ACI87E_000809 [Mariniblastus sp.]|jgi:hypothetical protein
MNIGSKTSFLSISIVAIFGFANIAERDGQLEY